MLHVSFDDLSPVVHEPRNDAYYRRLIYTACSGLLNKRRTALTLKLWDSHFAGQRSFSAIRFARVCRSALNLDTDTAKALTQKLTELSYGSDTELKEPVTAPISTRRDDEVLAETSVQTAFKVLVGELLNAAWREREGIVSHVHQLNPDAKRMLLRWSAAATPHIDVPLLSRPAMRKTLICIHVWLSERYSHAYADVLFDRALKNTQRLGSSFGFSVREI